MKRIILHWCGGSSNPNHIELEHYHYVVDRSGKIHQGNHKVSDNENCKDGDYAAHTGYGNTGSIGVAMCGMMGFKNSDNVGNYPLTKIQCEATFNLIANLALEYNIPVDKEHIFTHYTFNEKHNIKTGKIDIIFLPPYPHVLKDDIMSYIISKVKWYKEKNANITKAKAD